MPQATTKPHGAQADGASFSGWGTELREFFTGLDRDNTKSYFDEHRELYRLGVREPTDALVGVLEPDYGTARVFRPNRDIRFSSDKRPYHTNIGVEFSDSGAHHYLSVSATELIASVGVFRADRTWVERYRAAVAGSAGGALLEIVVRLESRGFTIGGSTLKAAPRGYSTDHPHSRLLRHRAMTASLRWPPAAWLGSATALQLITDAWGQARSLTSWLRTYVPIGG